MPAPTYPATAELLEGTGTRSFAAVNVLAGDWLVVEVIGEDGPSVATITPSGSGVTGTTVRNNIGPTGDVRLQQWTAQCTTGGSLTVTMTPSGGTNPTGARWHALLTVVRGVGGVGVATSSSAGQSISATRQGDNSGVFMTIGDFTVEAVGSPTWLPSGTNLIASQQGAGATYIFGRLDDSGPKGAGTHGITTPTYTTPSVGVLEVFGLPADGPVVPPIPPDAMMALYAAAMQQLTGGTIGGTGWTQNPTDDTGLTDAVVLEQDKVATDDTGLTDNAAVTQSYVKTDDTGLTDSATQQLLKLVAATDDTGLTDSIVIEQDKVFTDPAGLTDATALSVAPVFTDSTGLTDTSTLQLAKTVTQTDDTGLTDSLALQQAKVVTDTTGLTDAAAFTFAPVVSDSTGLTDSATEQVVKAVNATDDTGLTDGATFSRTQVLVDDTGLTDTTVLARAMVVVDSAGLSDSVTVAAAPSVAPYAYLDGAAAARQLAEATSSTSGATESTGHAVTEAQGGLGVSGRTEGGPTRIGGTPG